ncbi:hypothetical protein scyTo_0020821 [Scyliorhinus torazame]|uniref:peptidylprolyl isomerase n=1 Tax=Scyliorhinus torazame TaxID=75743 RepID=A0A401PNZ9_SCYTO|nr:hypothetical protein [Scyliorhinus torazame]
MEEMVSGNQGAAGDAGSQTMENKQDATVNSGKNLINTKASLLDSGEDIEMTNGDTDEDDTSELPSLEDIGLTKKLEAQSAAEEGLEASVMEVNEEAVSGKGNVESSQEPDDEWLQVLGNGLLKKKVLVAGQNKEQRPQKGQEVTVHLKMTLEDGTEVEEDPTLSFTVGDGDVIQALDLCVQLMDQEEVALIISDAKYAYGSLGRCDPVVDFAEEEEEELMAVKVKCLNNLAAAQLKLEHFEAALKSSEAALQHQPNNVKALFRKGKVLAFQGEYTEAIPVLRKASRLEPSNKAIQIELSQLLRKQSEQRSVEQAMYRKMLGNMAVPPHSSPSPAPWKIPWKWLFGATAVAIGGMAVSVIVAARTT